jgi:branched-chain amino acid transport system permease protein
VVKRLVYVGVLLLLIALPLAVTSKYLIQLINTALVFLIIVTGMNYVIGFSGQISLAATAFWGIGAYTSALLTTTGGISFWLALPVAATFATLSGFVIGFPTLKLKQFYLGIATVGFGEIVALILLNWTALTNGADGVPGIPKPAIGSYVFDTDYRFYHILLVAAVLLLLLSVRIKNSRFGRGLLAICEDELAAEVMGVPTHWYKMMAFALSAFYGGAAGSLYGHLIGFISPDLFVFRQSIVFLCMFMIGGSGYIAGPVIGAILLTLLPEWMRFLKGYYMAIYGLAVVVLAIGMPTGIMGLAERYLPRLYPWLEPDAEAPATLAQGRAEEA